MPYNPSLFPTRNLADLIAQDGRFTTLNRALSIAGLNATLAGAGNFGVFAPTDEAFRRLDPNTLAQLLRSPDKLRQVLELHVTISPPASIEALPFTSVTGRRGGATGMNSIGGVPVYSGQGFSNSTIDLKSGIIGTARTFEAKEATNGRVFVIDRVLLP